MEMRVGAHRALFAELGAPELLREDRERFSLTADGAADSAEASDAAVQVRADAGRQARIAEGAAHVPESRAHVLHRATRSPEAAAAAVQHVLVALLLLEQRAPAAGAARQAGASYHAGAPELNTRRGHWIARYVV